MEKGFVSSRNISKTNKIYGDQNNLTTFIFFLEYMKAFDRVEWDWTLKCLETFNFGSKFRS